MKKYIGLTAIAAVLTGCVTDPTTGQQTVSKTAVGAVIGAASGALIAKSNGDSDKAGRAAAIGAVVGGGVGLYMDRQAAKLREQMKGTGVDVKQNAQTGAIDLVMPSAITFAFNSASIDPKFLNTLNQAIITIKQYDKTQVQVSGYTDNVGSAAYNQNLSQTRAENVAKYMKNAGVAAERVTSVGYGMSKPVASNDTEEGRGQNRRVEITILPPATV